MLRPSGRCRTLLSCFWQSWADLGLAGPGLAELGNVGTWHAVLGYARRSWDMQRPAGRCRTVLSRFGKCWALLGLAKLDNIWTW
jgi:hypothetical protein